MLQRHKDYDQTSLGQFTASSSDNLFIVSETQNTQSSEVGSSKKGGGVGGEKTPDGLDTPPPLPAPRKESSKKKSKKIDEHVENLKLVKPHAESILPLENLKPDQKTSKLIENSNLPTQQNHLRTAAVSRENSQKQRRRGRDNKEKSSSSTKNTIKAQTDSKRDKSRNNESFKVPHVPSKSTTDLRNSFHSTASNHTTTTTNTTTSSTNSAAATNEILQHSVSSKNKMPKKKNQAPQPPVSTAIFSFSIFYLLEFIFINRVF